MEAKITQRSKAVEWSGIRVMFALADEIPDVINLGIGQPDFDTPAFIREAAKKALDEGYTRYPPAKGFADLRQAIAEKLARENRIQAAPETEIFVAVGAMQVIFNTILHLVEPGDEVIVIDPGYDYYSQIRLFGGVPVPVPARGKNGFKVDPADVRKAVSHRTRLIILNTPSNPTGAMFGEEILEAIAGTTMVLDELIVQKLFNPEAFLKKRENRYLPSSYLERFRLGREKHQRQFKGGEVFAPVKYMVDRKLLMALKSMKIPLLLSTDAGTGAMGIVPGFSLHDELRILVENGFTPYEAWPPERWSPRQSSRK